jgi:MFS family permease
MTQIGKHPCDDMLIQYGAQAIACTQSARRWVLVASIAGSIMVFIDGSVVNVALAAIQGDLGATAADLQWVVESCALFLASFLLVGGALGDRFGRRLILIEGKLIVVRKKSGDAA